MRHLPQIFLILFVELNIYQCIGCAMDRIRFFPRASSFLGRMIHGFLGYHFLFWCLAFPCTLANKSLDFVTILWCVCLTVLLVPFSLLHLKTLQIIYYDAFQTLCRHKKYFLLLFFLVAFLSFYACINGQSDIDARTYIGEVTTMLHTQRLRGVEITSGWDINKIYLRRAFSMFGTNSAVLCNIFKLHPLIFCRTIRTSINILLLAGSTFEISRWIYRKTKAEIANAAILTALSISLLFGFTNTIYSTATFVLHRSYEGKAYCSGTLILITIYLCIKLCNKEQTHWFWLIFICMIAGISISSSSIFILPLIVGCIVGAHILIYHKWVYAAMLFAALSPNMLYLILMLSGFVGF